MQENKHGGNKKLKMPKELERYGRVTLYAGNPDRKQRLFQLLELGDGKSLSEMIDLAVSSYLEREGENSHSSH